MEKFSQIAYERPDFHALRRNLKRRLSAFKSADSYEAAKAVYLAAKDEMEHVETNYVVASIRNTLDTTDQFYDGEMKFSTGRSPSCCP